MMDHETTGNADILMPDEPRNTKALIEATKGSFDIIATLSLAR
jgi:hypothetical protein